MRAGSDAMPMKVPHTVLLATLALVGGTALGLSAARPVTSAGNSIPAWDSSRFQQDRPAITHRMPQVTLIAQTKAEIVLGDSPVRVTLAAPPSERTPRSLASLVEALAPNQRLFLMLHGMRADAAPGALFHIFLDSPAGSAPDPKSRDPRRVGSLNFFNFVKYAGESAEKPARDFSRSYDITSLVRSLHRNAQLTPETTITIVPSHLLAPGSRPVIRRIEIVIESPSGLPG